MVVNRDRRFANEAELRTALSDLRSDLAQVNKMIRMLEWASGRETSRKN